MFDEQQSGSLFGSFPLRFLLPPQHRSDEKVAAHCWLHLSDSFPIPLHRCHLSSKKKKLFNFVFAPRIVQKSVSLELSHSTSPRGNVGRNFSGIELAIARFLLGSASQGIRRWLATTMFTLPLSTTRSEKWILWTFRFGIMREVDCLDWMRKHKKIGWGRSSNDILWCDWRLINWSNRHMNITTKGLQIWVIDTLNIRTTPISSHPNTILSQQGTPII